MVLYLTGKKTNQMTAEAVIVILQSIKKRNPYTLVYKKKKPISKLEETKLEYGNIK